MTISRQTSHTLLDRLQDRNDQAAWSIFVELYRPLMYRSMMQLNIGPDEVDDLVQDCLLKLLAALPSFAHNGRPGAFRTWLRTIATNRAIEFLKHRQRGAEAMRNLSDLVEPCANSISEFLDREHDHLVIGKLLEMIRPEFTKSAWLAFERQVIDGESAKVVAEEMGRTVNSVLLYKSRVLRKLRELGQGIVEC